MKKYYTLVAITLIILGSAFYWYSYRPSKIRARCLAEAEFNRFSIFSNDQERFQFIDNYYKTCLRRFGL